MASATRNSHGSKSVLLRVPDAGALGGSSLDPLTESVHSSLTLGQSSHSVVREAVVREATSARRRDQPDRSAMGCIDAADRLRRVRADRARRKQASGVIEDPRIVRTRAALFSTITAPGGAADSSEAMSKKEAIAVQHAWINNSLLDVASNDD